jgi:hypothetical protein
MMARYRLITAVVVLLVASLAFAQYKLPWNSINSGGAPGSGTGFLTNGSAAQAVQGLGTGTGYRGYWGFWYGAGRPRKVDVGVKEILAPAAMVDTHDVILPKATWHNYDAQDAATFDVWFILVDPLGARPYSEHTTAAGIAPGGDFTWEFTGYDVADQVGEWTARCSTWCGNDSFATNDVREKKFTVSAAPPWPEGWDEVKNVPNLPTTGKAVKDGAWLAMAEVEEPDASTRYVYVAKGNKTTDFYRYNPGEDSFVGLSPIKSD